MLSRKREHFGQRLLAALGLVHRELPGAQSVPQEAPDGPLVTDDQHPGGLLAQALAASLPV